MSPQPVELTISFQGGAGVTRSVSREDVRFVTDHPPDVGQMIEGTLRTLGADENGLVNRLRYAARVVAVRKPNDGGWEVEAQFEDLSFATPEPA
jgi:hypothetical protein